VKTGKGQLEDILTRVALRKATGRLVEQRMVAGPRGSTRFLLMVDGWPVAAVRPTGEVVTLDPGPEAPSGLRAINADGYVRRPRSHLGLEAAIEGVLWRLL
jgi:hypothetical protein